MKILLIVLLAYTGLGICQAQQSDSDRKATQLLSGMYEVVSWHDGTTLHTSPAVVGRWSFIEGNVMCIIHNRVNPDESESAIGWGYGSISDGIFTIAYPEFITTKGSKEGSIIDQSSPFEGERKYKITFTSYGILMKSFEGTQTWEVHKDKMVYTDHEWGPDKKYAQRTWKRLTE